MTNTTPTPDTIQSSLQIPQSLREQIQDAISAPIPTAITSEDQLTAISSVAKTCKTLVKQIEDIRKAFTTRLDTLKKHLITQERDLTAPLTTRLDALKTISDIYLEQRRQIAEAARIAAAEAAAEAQRKLEEARRAQEQASAQAALGIQSDKATQEAALQAAQDATQAVNAAANALTPTQLAALAPVQGLAIRTTWDFQIINSELLPRRLLTPDPSLIRAELQHLKKSGQAIRDVNIPGLSVFEKTSAALR